MAEETNSSWSNFRLAPAGAFGSKVTSILQVEFVRRFESFEKILSFFDNSSNFLRSLFCCEQHLHDDIHV